MSSTQYTILVVVVCFVIGFCLIYTRGDPTKEKLLEKLQEALDTIDGATDHIAAQNELIAQYESEASLYEIRASKCHEKMNYQQLEIEKLTAENTMLKQNLRMMAAERADQATVINPLPELSAPAPKQRFPKKKHRPHRG